MPTQWPKLLFQSTLIALAMSLLLTLWAHLAVCCGMHPETLYCVDTAAPLMGVFCGAAWAGCNARSSRSRLSAGALIAGASIVFWFAAWGFLVARFEPMLWWYEAVCGLTARHVIAWSAALLIGMTGAAIGGMIGGRVRSRARHQRWGKRWSSWMPVWMLALASMMFLLLFIMQASIILRGEDSSGRNITVSPGMTVICYAPQPDGTQVRLLTFDSQREPGLGIGLYDADSGDAVPWDDRNTTWLGHSIEFVHDKLQNRLARRGRELRCLINGGFFGAQGLWVGHHIAPLVVQGKIRYDTRILQKEWPDQAWVLGIAHRQGRPRFYLRPQKSGRALKGLETALGGVRPLRLNGHSLLLRPGMGGTGLRCSRTSLGWNADSTRLFVLSVRDPDGEAASGQQRKTGQVETGGWDVRQVQQFWEEQRVPQAVLFDGGESTQLAYADHRGRSLVSHSAWHLSRTLGYWRGRPLRIYVPLLPAAANDGGVLNYLYLDGPAQSRR
jgi:hypothetical protein